LSVCVTQQAVGLDHHRIARQDGHILTPLGIDRGLATAQQGVVHDIVVQERKVVEHLDCRSRRQGALVVVGKERIGKHQQHGAQALTAPLHRVADWDIKQLRLGRHLHLCQVIFHLVKHFFGVYHLLKDLIRLNSDPKIGKIFVPAEFCLNFGVRNLYKNNKTL